MSERTLHGFRSGSIEVEALAETSRGSVVGVTSATTAFEIAATPKGRDTIITMVERPRRRSWQRLRIRLPNGLLVIIHESEGYSGVSLMTAAGRYVGHVDAPRDDEPL